MTSLRRTEAVTDADLYVVVFVSYFSMFEVLLDVILYIVVLPFKQYSVLLCLNFIVSFVSTFYCLYVQYINCQFPSDTPSSL